MKTKLAKFSPQRIRALISLVTALTVVWFLVFAKTQGAGGLSFESPQLIIFGLADLLWWTSPLLLYLFLVRSVFTSVVLGALILATYVAVLIWLIGVNSSTVGISEFLLPSYIWVGSSLVIR